MHSRSDLPVEVAGDLSRTFSGRKTACLLALLADVIGWALAKAIVCILGPAMYDVDKANYNTSLVRGLLSEQPYQHLWRGMKC